MLVFQKKIIPFCLFQEIVFNWLKIQIFEEMLRELEDYDWFPAELRKQQTGYIGWMVRAFKVYDFLIHEIDKEAENHQRRITDLCSGNGGPWQSLATSKKLSNCEIVLTDLYPQIPAQIMPNCKYEPSPVSALNCKDKAKGLVTMFNAFHHFNSFQRKEIVKQMIENERTFMVCEILRPNLLDFFRIFLATTFGQLLFAPFVTPFSLKRILFTYVIPINIVTVAYDGMLSVFKSLSAKDWNEMLDMISEMGGEARIIRKNGIFVHTTALVCKRKETNVK